METITLPHLPHHPLRIVLFSNVTNAAFLRQQLLQGNSAFEYAFLDARLLLSRRQLFAASFRAVSDLLNGRLKSRNVHSEIVFSLSPNNNIAESFRRFGISDDSVNVVAIKVGGDASQIEQHLLEHVEGEPVPLTDETLAGLCDYGRIRKIYKVEVASKGDVEASRREAEVLVLGAMALKGT